MLVISEAAYLERPGNPEPRNRRLRTGGFSGLAPYQNKYAATKRPSYDPEVFFLNMFKSVNPKSQSEHLKKLA